MPQTHQPVERAQPAGCDVLVVSHGVTLLAYLAMVSDAPLRPLLNASVSTVHLNIDCQRIAGDIGQDPSGTEPPQTNLGFVLKRVPLEGAASWAAVQTVTS